MFGNTPTDFSGITAGKNTIRLNPKFRGQADYRLQPTSPCVDAGDDKSVPAVLGNDASGNPRRLDGKQQGRAARVDLGSEELTQAALTVLAPAKLGNVAALRTTAPAGSVFSVLADLRGGNTVISPYGNFLLTPSFLLIGGGTAPGNAALPIPPVAQFAGIRIRFQAITARWLPTPVGYLTNDVELVVH